MQIASTGATNTEEERNTGDNLHEMSNSVFWKKE